MRTLKPGIATLLIVLLLWTGALNAVARERTPVQAEAHRIARAEGGRIECYDGGGTCFVINKSAGTITTVYMRYGKVQTWTRKGQ
jgi:hypothetical protein